MSYLQKEKQNRILATKIDVLVPIKLQVEMSKSEKGQKQVKVHIFNVVVELLN